MPAVRNRQRASGIYPCSTVVITVKSEGEIHMISKILSGALLAGFMLSLAAPIRSGERRVRIWCSGIYAGSTVVITVKSEGEIHMISKILSGALLAGFMLSVAAPIVAVGADAPKTKADCEEAKDMKWDKTTKSCVKK